MAKKISVNILLMNGSLILNAYVKWGAMKKVPESGFQKHAILRYGRERFYTNKGDHIKAIWKRINPKK